MTLWVAETYEPLPPGLYVGELLDIESRESANGQYRRWGWEILEGPYAGRKVYANTSTNFGRKQRHAGGSRTFWAGSWKRASISVSRTSSAASSI